MHCRDARGLLTTGGDRPAALASHLEACAACARYASRLESARRMLREHHGRVEPDSGFAERVAANLPHATTDILGWAATRLLPATLALVIVLGWFALQARSAPDAVTAPTDDLLSWVIESDAPEGRQ